MENYFMVYEQEQFDRVNKRKSTANKSSTEIIKKSKKLEDTETADSLAVSMCSSLGRLIDEYAMNGGDKADILQLLSEHTFSFVQKMIAKKNIN